MPSSFIAFTGRKRSGKDTAAELLKERGYIDIKMAGGLKAMLMDLFQHMEFSETQAARFIEDECLKTEQIIPMPPLRAELAVNRMIKVLLIYVGVPSSCADLLTEDPNRSQHSIGELKGVTVAHLRETLTAWLNIHVKPGVTPRTLMQTLGTEWGRDAVFSDLWIHVFKRRAAQFDRVICTDIRFLNEAVVVRSGGGVLIKIDADDRLGPNLDPHPSEQEMAQIKADLVIENNGTLDDFMTSCRSTLEGLIE